MAFLNSINIIGSALTAERFRSDIILQNISNQNTTRTESGEPYRRKQVIFQEREQSFNDVLNKVSGGGVRVTEVVESQEDFKPVYDPDHPDADEDGYVYYPNVNNTEEQVDLMDASRVYEANVSALSVVKAMASKALEIGK
ncbi:flagellar basal body rod protein FlgC [Porcipelethomonas sp.]|uniref:flagellar basal body rod protein FlgC n=1 Tax=Porcipelethomonas sp. TaxID=2981675 RepID=UPI003EF1E0B3